MRIRLALLIFTVLLFYGCNEEPPPDCDALNVGVPVQINSEYPNRMQFYYRVISNYRDEIDSKSGILGRSITEYECKDRALDLYSFDVDGVFDGSKTVERCSEIVLLLQVKDTRTNEDLFLDNSAKTATSLFISEEGQVVGTDLIN